MESVIIDSLKGKVPIMIADEMRKMLFQSNADFEEVRKFAYVTTSQGRNYKRK